MKHSILISESLDNLTGDIFAFLQKSSYLDLGKGAVLGQPLNNVLLIL